MYYDFFGFREPPFSIAPDPRYLYLSERHKEALAHLMYGVRGQGGFIVITGEVGTGKTTVSRCFIGNVPDYVDIALILNPRLSARELLSSVCDELGIRHPARATIKELVDLINRDLLDAHARGRHKVLMIDEAQNLSTDVLEQLRLLTNLETAEKKLLQIVLLGQPELQEILSRPELRQLNQRVTARYHLDSLDRDEIGAYLRYRTNVAGLRGDIFTEGAVRQLYKATRGIPRLINLVTDRALLGAYAEGEHEITAAHIRSAAKEVGARPSAAGNGHSPRAPVAGADSFYRIALLVAVLATVFVLILLVVRDPVATGTVPETAGEDDGPAQAVPPEPAVETPSARSSTVRRAEAAVPQESESDDLAAGKFSFDRHTLPLVTAFRILHDTWGFGWNPTENPIACDFATRVGLDCMRRQGSRSSLELVNRPVILTLRDSNGDQSHTVLRRLNGSKATIQLEQGRQETVDFASLERYWYGHYLALYRLPEHRRKPLGDADREREENIWLETRMMALAGALAKDPAEEQRIRQLSLEERVRWYQRRRGLEVDGIPGPMTVVQIHNDLDTPGPRLRERGVIN
ncbi:MAG: AAA family ATPase [Pseudomonadota bacterium]|nr:AAA family ATPase [Pseudomonadota bacterium]